MIKIFSLSKGWHDYCYIKVMVIGTINLTKLAEVKVNKFTSIQNIIAAGIVDKITPMDYMKWMPRKFVEYQLKQRLILAFPVKEKYSNPLGSMQGGVISAAFDHTFGSLVYLITKKMNMVTVDLDVTYHRPIYTGDTLTVIGDVRNLGSTIVHIVGEAYNESNKLIASASSSLMLLNKEAYAASPDQNQQRRNSFQLIDGNRMI